MPDADGAIAVKTLREDLRDTGPPFRSALEFPGLSSELPQPEQGYEGSNFVQVNEPQKTSVSDVRACANCPRDPDIRS